MTEELYICPHCGEEWCEFGRMDPDHKGGTPSKEDLWAWATDCGAEDDMEVECENCFKCFHIYANHGSYYVEAD